MLILIAMLLAGVATFTFPELILPAKPILQPAFAVTMFFVGTLSKREQVRAFTQSHWRSLSGTAVQYTVMPLLAFAIAHLLDDPLLHATSNRHCAGGLYARCNGVQCHNTRDGASTPRNTGDAA